MRLPKGFQLVEDEGENSNINLPQGFQLMESNKSETGTERTRREFDEMYQRNEGEWASKGVGALQGLSRLAERLTGSLQEPVTATKPNQTEKQKDRQELFSDIFEGTGEVVLPLPGGPVSKLVEELGASKALQYMKSVFKRNPAKNSEKILRELQSLAEREAIMGYTPKRGSIEAPVSRYELGQEILKEMGNTEAQALGIEMRAPEIAGGRSLQGRVQGGTEKQKPLGTQVKLSDQGTGKSLEGRLKPDSGPGSSISKEVFSSNAQGGRTFNQDVITDATQSRKRVSKLYESSAKANDNINSIADETLIGELNQEIESLRKSASPNTAESAVLKKLEDIRKDYIIHNHMPVGRLIRTSDSLTGMSKYELPFNGPKDILKKAAKYLDNAAIRAIENNGGNADLFRQANKEYGKWARKYANDEIVDFLQRDLKNPESLFKKVIDNPASFRSVENALVRNARSEKALNAASREIAEKRMKDFMGKNLEKVGSQEYQKAIRDLREVIGSSRAKAFDRSLRNKKSLDFTQRYKGRTVPSITKQKELPTKKLGAERITKAKTPYKIKVEFTPKKEAGRVKSLEKFAERAAKTYGKTPEQMMAKLKMRSGISELKKNLSPQLFEKVIEYDTLRLLKEGKINSRSTGKDWYNVLNKENNFEIFSEYLGKDETTQLLNEFNALSDQEITNQTMTKVFKTMGKKAARYLGAWKLLSGLLVL